MAIVYLGMVGITGYMMQSGSWESCTIKVKSLNVVYSLRFIATQTPIHVYCRYIVIYEGQEDQWSRGCALRMVVTPVPWIPPVDGYTVSQLKGPYGHQV